ncbi:EF-hand domain-containing protein [Devosia beringensis]|uniref:EF-hand domain-containing protein n=1 Tax=Devosia beringensis TaxID=2657486 RepID=UPI00186B8D4E|nr:EF-hand domain-containing protein [Devosia beringensis]
MSTTSGIGAQSASQLMRTAFKPPSFASLDSNSDNSLTLDEIKLNAPKDASSAQANKRAEALFSAMDGDGGGSVTSSEKDIFDTKMAEQGQSMAFMTQQLAGPSNADIFAATDSDGDGAVTLAELGDDEGAGAISDENLQKLFDMIDGNGDGSITETESSSFLDAVKTALQDSASSTGSQQASGPPPGGPPPGGPPPASDDAEEDDTTTSASLLATAQIAYKASQQQTLLEQLAAVFSAAA